MRNRIIALVFLLVFPAVSLAQSKKQEVKRISIEGSTSIANFSEAGKYVYGVFDAGVLRKDEKYELTLLILNQSGQPLTFNSVSTNCHCSNVDLPAGVVEANESVKAIVKFSTPSTVYKGDFRFRVSIFSGKKLTEEVCSIDVKAKVAGTLQFDKSRTLFEARGKINEWKIPFSFSSPVKFSRIKMATSDSLADFTAKMEKTSESEGILTWSAPLSAHDGESLSGSFTISDSKTNSSDTIEVLITKEPAFVVVPATISLRKKDDNTLVGNAMLRSYAEEQELRFECEIDGKPCKMKTRELIKDKVYRVVFDLSKELPDDRAARKSSKIRWKVSIDGKNYFFSQNVEWEG